jgi:protein involved in polysaccharide export with SLBB domain
MRKILGSWLVALLILFLFCFGSGAEEQSSYRLGPGDKVRIKVFGEQEMDLDTTLSDAGTVIYPFMGEIKVSGLTISQVAALVTGGLKDRYLIDPKVSVSVLEYREFFIDGEVTKPGGYPYQPGLTVQKAVSLAGGFSERASRSRITIVREKDPSHIPSKVSLDTAVMPGDIVTVEESFF